LLLWLQKKIYMKIFINRSQESLRKNSWGPIAMFWLWAKIINFRPNFLLFKNGFSSCFWSKFISFSLIKKNSPQKSKKLSKNWKISSFLAVLSFYISKSDMSKSSYLNDLFKKKYQWILNLFIKFVQQYFLEWMKYLQ
jgi:hypothetical protein